MTVLQLDNASDVTPANLKKLESLVSNKTTVLLNHANWCGHCNMFKPQWEEFKKNAGKGVNLVQIESDALTQIQKDNKIYKRVTPKDGMVYFPMIIIFVKKDGKASEKKIYDGNRSAADLKTFIDTKVKPTSSSKPKKEPVKKTGKKVTKKTKTEKKEQVPNLESNRPLSLQKLNNELNAILEQINRL